MIVINYKYLNCFTVSTLEFPKL